MLATLRRTCIAQTDAPDWLAKLLDAPEHETRFDVRSERFWWGVRQLPDRRAEIGDDSIARIFLPRGLPETYQ
jgi:hypothetical protein